MIKPERGTHESTMPGRTPRARFSMHSSQNEQAYMYEAASPAVRAFKSTVFPMIWICCAPPCLTPFIFLNISSCFSVHGLRRQGAYRDSLCPSQNHDNHATGSSLHRNTSSMFVLGKLVSTGERPLEIICRTDNFRLSQDLVRSEPWSDIPMVRNREGRRIDFGRGNIDISHV